LPSTLACPRLYGCLQEWDVQRACGFIECKDPPGKRLFAHKSEFIEQFADGAEPPLGTPVSFVYGTDLKSGKERARSIQVERHAASLVQYGALRLHGTLMEWNSEKACGFIECGSVPGKRFFAHKTEFAEQFVDGADPPVGTALNFVLGVDSRSGKQRAQDIRTGDGIVSEALGAAHQVAFGQPRLRGTLDEWNGLKACGFIHCLDLPGKKCFAHKSEFAEQFVDGSEPPPGTVVSFALGIDARSGKERAQDIRVEGDPGLADSLGPPRLLGVLADWKAKSACGFVECIDPPGKRYFAHKSEFAEQFPDGAEPPLGTTLSFTPGVDQRSGRERAQGIRVELVAAAGLKRDAVAIGPAPKRLRPGSPEGA